MMSKKMWLRGKIENDKKRECSDLFLLSSLPLLQEKKIKEKGSLSIVIGRGFLYNSIRIQNSINPRLIRNGLRAERVWWEKNGLKMNVFLDVSFGDKRI
ncbi:hypothetical protein CEXT_516021 [Caerostris extrusa]|uniref:Uncharacterized protein n=1 Tax=Caerostris extrusa TaxID=172846 RepID=A0AAV4MSD9_CAEEX|nr:hypothetical protein CEXT_516021 [Caerostris extrusa]